MKPDDRTASGAAWRAMMPNPVSSLDVSGWEQVFQSAQVPLYVQDISEVHVAVAEVRRSGVEDFEAWLAAHPEFITRVVDLIRVVDVNEAAVRINGAADRAEMLNSLSRLVTPESLSGFRNLVLAVARGDRYYEGECEYCTLDGRTYYAMNRAWIPGPDQPDQYLVLANFDITDLKLAQQALAGSEERYRLLVETARDVIIRHDLNGRVTFVNQAGLDLTGLSRDRILGREFLDFVPPEDQSLMQERRIQRTRGHAGVFLYETVFVKADGTQVPIEVSSTLIPGSLSGQNEPQVLIVARDTSERKRALREQRELESRLQDSQRLESLGELAGGIAHDFNNLLVTIMGNAELALEDLADDSPNRENLDAILQASAAAADLCRQMQTYAGSGPISARPCDLTAVVNDIKRLLQVSVVGRSHIHFELANRLPRVTIDEAQIRQVLMNLVANSAESLGEEGGEIMVRSGEVELTHADLKQAVNGGALEPGRAVYCEVQDSGCGMDPAVAARLFDPFYSTKLAGRGLGMSAVLGIVKSHGGCLTLRTSPRRGTTVRFMLPIADQDRDRRHAGTSPQAVPVNLEGRLILVVDDDALVRQVGMSFLRRLGCKVLAAADGYEAIRVFGERHEDIDAVLMDFTMTGLDGLTTCRRLRVIRSDIPVILSSGHDLADRLGNPEDLGCTGFVSKPFTLQQMGAEIGRVLADTESSRNGDSR